MIIDIIFILIVLLVISIFYQYKYSLYHYSQDGGAESNENLDNSIQGLVYSSNNDNVNINQNYSSKFASLNSKNSWGGNPQAKLVTYLQVDLPDYYLIEGIVTKGRSNSKEWVTSYYLEYYDKYNDNWIKYPQVLTGNKNDMDTIINPIKIETDKIRVYPVEWNNYPSLRVGLIGKKQTFSKCRYYRSKLTNGSEMEKPIYHELYTKNCLKVSKHIHDEVLDNLRQANDKVSQTNKELETLKKQYNLIKEELDNLRQTTCPKIQLIELAEKYRDIIRQKCQK